MSPSNSKPTSPITINNPSTSSSDLNPPMPATPPSPSSPRAVRFPSTGSPVTGSSRNATLQESWSFHHFENHARKCHHCYLPYDSYKVGHRLCSEGCNLAADTLRHVYRRDGHVYSRLETGHLVHVEMDRGYVQVRQVLKLVERYGTAAIEYPSASRESGKKAKKHKDKHRRHSRDHDHDHSHGRNDSGSFVYYSPMDPNNPYTPPYGYPTITYVPSSPTHYYPDRVPRSPTKSDIYGQRDASTSATVGSRDPGFIIKDYTPASSSSKKHGKSRRH